MSSIQIIFFSISIVFTSMAIGAVCNQIIKKQDFYHRLSNLQFVKSDFVYKLIGIKIIKWLVYKTFWRHFNKEIQVSKSKPSLEELQSLKRKMTDAEVSHLIAMIFIFVFAIGCFLFGKIQFGIVLIIANIFFNLYPSLLQQKNKQRIDRIIRRIHLN